MDVGRRHILSSEAHDGLLFKGTKLARIESILHWFSRSQFPQGNTKGQMTAVPAVDWLDKRKLEFREPKCAMVSEHAYICSVEDIIFITLDSKNHYPLLWRRCPLSFKVVSKHDPCYGGSISICETILYISFHLKILQNKGQSIPHFFF